ncbi:bifunctional SulP family inorganic anion transporter/carbonic anhydrase [Streptomyces sp. 150FB]|uniref:SulP family inorganic anion transporter n=1 Tax=Streptomyces sp. 150FB TaxID=1576605 RepID=UPI000696B321|nr:bifunctional SulP family inorganic anion transporter/carbonic anhydrase [Streptomyces sp. 150FB]
MSVSAYVPTRTDPPAQGPPPPRRRPRITGGDLSASITVFLIAVPMSLGLAVAMDAPLEAGLIAAAVGGIVAGLLGGSPFQVSGPSAGLTVVTAELIQRYGWRTTCAITVCAGLVQIALGSLRAARSALAVSPAIVHGTLAGIGVAIALAQLHVVLGGSPGSSAVDNALALPEQIGRIGPEAPLVGALTIAVLMLWPRLPGRTGRALRTIPAALACVVIATGVAAVATPGITRVDLPSWSTHVLPEAPRGAVLPLVAAVLTMTLVAGLESLLSAVAVDKLAGDRARSSGRRRSDLDRELRGQGIANVLSGLLGGLAVSGGAVRGSANVRAGATGRASTVLHGAWVLLAAWLLVPVLEWIPLAALGALVMMVGIQMVSFAHIRNVHKHREFLVYGTTVAGVVVLGVLYGVLIGIAVAVAVALHRLARTRITVEKEDGRHRVRARGQLTFLAVPRLIRVLHQVPEGAICVVELDGSFMDHAAYEALHEWQTAHTARGGTAEFTGRSGGRIAEPATETHACCRPWTPWRNHHCGERPVEERTQQAQGASSAERAGAGAGTDTGRDTGTGTGTGTGQPIGGAPRSSPSPFGPADVRRPSSSQLASGLSSFQRNTAPLVRNELARLAREGQRPSQLFLTCADSRLVTSMITSSGPGDLFTVRNVGNLVPLPGADCGDDSVAAAIEYAVGVLNVESITVCGHSGCGAMQALLNSPPDAAGPATPLRRWLRHGKPSLERMESPSHPWARISGRLPTDAVEQLCLTNVVQQLEHLRAHEAVARRIADGRLELHGMYFHVGEAQAYLLADAAEAGTASGGSEEVFDRVPATAPTVLDGART